MSILKTTLKVESADSTSKINILTSNNVDLTAGVVHRKIKLNAGTQKAISTPENGARGNFLYVKSSDSNPKHTSIQIESKNTGRIITLYAGEYGLIPLSSQDIDGVLGATVTHGTAELEYFFGTRGEELGENMIIVYDNDGWWFISTLDVSTGIPNDIYNTGVRVNEYPNVSFMGVVDRKGYTIQISSGGGSYVTLCINRYGRIVWNTSVTNYSFYRGNGKANLITWNENNVANAIYFDGDRVYQHQFPNAKDIYVEDNWDECTNDGTFPIKVVGYEGRAELEALLLIKGAGSKLIKTTNNNSGESAIAYAYSNGNFIAVENWGGKGRVLESLEIFNSKGTLLKRVNLNMREIITYYQFYGTGKLQIAYELGGRIRPIPGEFRAQRFTFLNYNQLTGKLIGEDLKWGSDYNAIDIVCDTYGNSGRSKSADYKPESVAILMHNNNGYNGDYFLNLDAGENLEVTYIINNDTKQRNYIVPLSEDKTSKGSFFYPSEYLHASINDFILLTAENTSEGPVIATRFTSGAEPTRFNLLDNIRNYYTRGLDNDNWIDTQCFGDYRYLEIPSIIQTEAETTVGDRNIIVYDSKVLDKTTVGFNVDYSTSGEYNSLLLVDWNNEITSYFNTSTKKWVQPKLSGSISDYWNAYNEGDQYPVGLSKQLVVSTNWTPTLTTLYVTPITKGIAGKEKEIIKLDTTNTDGRAWWDLSMSTETIVLSYKYGESDTWKFRVYDLNFNFLYEIDTKVINLNNASIVGRINFKMLIGDGNIFSFYNFNKLLNKQTLEIKSGRYNFTSNNFSLYEEKKKEINKNK